MRRSKAEQDEVAAHDEVASSANFGPTPPVITINSSPEFIEVDQDDVVVDQSMNGRRFSAPADDLAADILARGQLQPIGVQRREDGRFDLVWGDRRVRAVKEINAKGLHPSGKLKLHAVVFSGDRKAAILANLHENLDRSDLSPIDLAHYIDLLVKEHGMRQAEVATEMKRSEAAVSQTHSLLKLAECDQRLVHDGTIPASIARELVKGDAKTRQRFISRFRDGTEEDRPTLAEVKMAVAAHRPPKAATVPTRDALPECASAPTLAGHAGGQVHSVKANPGSVHRRLTVGAATTKHGAVAAIPGDAADSGQPLNAEVGAEEEHGFIPLTDADGDGNARVHSVNVTVTEAVAPADTGHSRRSIAEVREFFVEQQNDGHMAEAGRALCRGILQFIDREIDPNELTRLMRNTTSGIYTPKRNANRALAADAAAGPEPAIA